MEISHVSAHTSGYAGVGAPQAKAEAPQPQAAAAPAVPNDGVRVSAPESAKKTSISDTEIKHALEAINRFLNPANGNIEFSQDADTGKSLVKIVDTQTQTVLRQIPTKEALEIAKQLDRLQGLLVREQA
jgi:flagellar protein FlaG